MFIRLLLASDYLSDQFKWSLDIISHNQLIVNNFESARAVTLCDENICFFVLFQQKIRNERINSSSRFIIPLRRRRAVYPANFTRVPQTLLLSEAGSISRGDATAVKRQGESGQSGWRILTYITGGIELIFKVRRVMGFSSSPTVATSRGKRHFRTNPSPPPPSPASSSAIRLSLSPPSPPSYPPFLVFSFHLVLRDPFISIPSNALLPDYGWRSGKSDGPSVFAIGGTCEFPGSFIGSLVYKILGEKCIKKEKEDDEKKKILYSWN